MGANAQTSVPAFTSGQVLTAAQVTQINTGIPVFASSTERDAAFGGAGEKTLAEGQMAYLEDTNDTQVYDGSAWAAVAGGKILQVVSTAKTDSFSTTSTSAVDVTGLSAAITPSSASNNVLVTVSFPCGMSVTNYLSFQLRRGSTLIHTGWSHPQSTSEVNYVTLTYLDSPASTSAQTYKLQMFVATGTGYVGRRGSDAVPTIPSSITVMEVSA